MKLLLSFLILSCCFNAQAYKGQFSVKGGSWAFTTENVKATSEASRGIGAYSFEAGYSLIPKYLFVFGMNILMAEIYTGSTGYGFDVGVKYFPISETGTTSTESSRGEVNIQEIWRPYVGVFLRQRIFSLALSTSYMGPGLNIGLDYSLGEKWFLNGEFRYDYLYGQGNALAQQTNILVGIGTQF